MDEIESTLMPALTHVAPRPGADAGVLRRHGRILLVQRMDDRLWAMPGGGLEIGETVAEGASRETWEETGVEVRPLALAGVWDSRLCGTRANHHLYQFVVLCEPLDEGAEPGGSNETLGAGWFDPADLPELSPGHALRIQGLLTFVRDRVAFLDL